MENNMEDVVRRNVVRKFSENFCMWTKEEEDAEVKAVLDLLTNSDQVA